MPVQGKSITLIIPILNGEKFLPDFFRGLKEQTLRPDEILVADSGSDDRSVAISRDFGADIIEITREQFDHGGTRTMLAGKASGDILVFVTQDAIPASSRSLENLILPLLQSDRIACSYGRQLPQADATPVSSHLRHFNYPDQSGVRGWEDRQGLGLKSIFISNSFAAYKKAPLEEVGYFKNGLIFGEDTCTLGRLFLAGYLVAYQADAEVYHSHNYDYLEEFRRSFDIGVLHCSENWLLETFGRAEGIGRQYLRSLFVYLFENKHYFLLLDSCVRAGCKFIGYKLGRNYRRIPRIMRPALSMHRLWWHKTSF